MSKENYIAWREPRRARDQELQRALDDLIYQEARIHDRKRAIEAEQYQRYLEVDAKWKEEGSLDMREP